MFISGFLSASHGYKGAKKVEDCFRCLERPGVILNIFNYLILSYLTGKNIYEIKIGLKTIISKKTFFQEKRFLTKIIIIYS